ncbi:archaellin/type IV pilin N-terminal domain-containing protein [Stetteria hydrogenophila]
MRAAKRAALSRRGLSSLIATVVLISATIVGGLAVYNYFQKSMDTVAATSATLALSVRSEYLNADTRLVFIEATNLYDVPVNITSVYVVDGNGGHVQVPAGSVRGAPVTVEPGAKATIIAAVPSSATAVYLVYQADGKILYTEPAPLR